MDRDWLYNEYVVKDRASKDIAAEYGCKQNTIQCWLAKHKIKKEIKHDHSKGVKKYPNITKEYLLEEHINKHRSLTNIANELHVDSDTLKRYCEDYQIKWWKNQHPIKVDEDIQLEICDRYTNDKISTNKLGEIYGISHGTVKRVLKNHECEIRSFKDAQLVYFHDKLPDLFYDADELRRLHWEEGVTCVELGEMIGVAPKTIRSQMNSLGVETKNNSECKIGLMTGENHPNWKGGICELYSLLREYFGTNIAPKIRKRDGYKCQLCGSKDELHVHHIIHFKDIISEIINEHPDLDVQTNKQELYDIIVKDKRFLDEDNLITYCKDCHLFKIHGYKHRDN